MSRQTLSWSLSWLGVVSAFVMLSDAVAAEEPFLARGARAEAAIVIGQDSGPFFRWVASEVRRYVRELSGAELPIVTADALPPRGPLIVLGSPATRSQ
jgi:hypothetical protein